jgi:shikimate kinase
VLLEDNRRCLRERGFVVYLETTLEDQLARLARDRRRPLLAAPDRRERLRSLAAIRSPLYHEVADLTIPASHHRNVAALAKQLAGELAAVWRRGTAPEQAA